MPDITESEAAAIYELVRLLRKQGVAMGNELSALIAQGNLNPNKPIELIISAEEIRKISPNFDNLPLVPSFFMKLGEPESSLVVNSLITGSGVVTAGWSAIRLSVTRDPIAKGCYCASIVFSSGAVASGSMAVISRMCKISEVAILSEIVGGAFLCLGEMAQAQALKAEGKPIPARLQKWAKPRIPFRQSAYSNQNLGFIMPGGMSHTGLSDIIEHIPFEKIGKVVGISLTAYGYYKIVIISYHYGQKIIRKLKEYRQNKLIEYRSTSLHRRIHFLAISLCNRPSFRRTLLIYEFAIS